MAKEDNIISLLSRKDQLEFLALTVQIPRVHKMRWKEEKISRDWLKRISALNPSIIAVNNVTTANGIEVRLLKIQAQTESQNSQLGLTSPLVIDPVEMKPKSAESFPNLEPVSQTLKEQCQSRKPDSTYISLISQINVPISFVETSERRCSDVKIIAPNLTPEKKMKNYHSTSVQELLSPPFSLQQCLHK